MARVLVTGGTGVLGRRLAPLLCERGHEVRVLSRRSAQMSTGVQSWLGDVRTGEGVGPAVAGVDTVVHAATNPRRSVKRTEVAGVRNVVDAIGGTGTHLIYVSIVGVDRNRFPYYRAKWAAEQVVEAAAAPWTIQRATQFHELLDMFLGYPAFIKTPNLAFQVVDVGEVAGRLADLVDAGPSGRAPDFGGPEVVPVSDLAATRREITGERSRLVRAPRVGFIRDFDDGYHLCPDRRNGRVTWTDWLHARAATTPER